MLDRNSRHLRLCILDPEQPPDLVVVRGSYELCSGSYRGDYIGEYYKAY